MDVFISEMETYCTYFRTTMNFGVLDYEHVCYGRRNMLRGVLNSLITVISSANMINI